MGNRAWLQREWDPKAALLEQETPADHRRTHHLAGLAGVRDRWNPEPGGMLRR